VNIDMAALKSLVREKDVSLDTVVEALEQALFAAYERTEGAQPRARVVLDRKSGEVTVFAQEVDEDGQVVREYDDTRATSDASRR
jgi:N utilization substance protein A